jgi:hypothetical protein
VIPFVDRKYFAVRPMSFMNGLSQLFLDLGGHLAQYSDNSDAALAVRDSAKRMSGGLA